MAGAFTHQLRAAHRVSSPTSSTSRASAGSSGKVITLRSKARRPARVIQDPSTTTPARWRFELIHDGILDGVSLEARPEEDGYGSATGVVQRVKAHLRSGRVLPLSAPIEDADGHCLSRERPSSTTNSNLYEMDPETRRALPTARDRTTAAIPGAPRRERAPRRDRHPRRRHPPDRDSRYFGGNRMSATQSELRLARLIDAARADHQLARRQARGARRQDGERDATRSRSPCTGNSIDGPRQGDRRARRDRRGEQQGDRAVEEDPSRPGRRRRCRGGRRRASSTGRCPPTPATSSSPARAARPRRSKASSATRPRSTGPRAGCSC